MPDNPDYSDILDQTVDEVKEYVRQHDVDIKQLLDYEKQNKGRKTLKQWLKNRVDANGSSETSNSRQSDDSVSLQFSRRQAFTGVFLLGVAVGFLLAGMSSFSLAGAITGMPGDNGNEPATNGDNNQEADGPTVGDTNSYISVSNIVIDNEPVTGSSDASAVMVLYEDFQCPACRAFEQRTMPQIMSNYVESGDLKLVWKDFPLTRIHPWAEGGAVAMECVYRQSNDVFWQVKDTVFSNQNSLSTSNAQSTIIDWAVDEGASRSAIEDCVAGNDALNEVTRDKEQDARSFDVTYTSRGREAEFVGATPSAVVYPANGDQAVGLVGGGPYQKYADAIEWALSQ